MIPSNIRAALLAAAAVAATAVVLGAQMDTAKPVRLKSPKPQTVRFNGEVIHADSVQMTVRSRENERVIKTFTYSPKVKEQMQRVIERGGYRVGDRVVVKHEAGSSVALKIQGKPSKPH